MILKTTAGSLYVQLWYRSASSSRDNLFVRQYGLVIRAPVDRRSFLYTRPFLYSSVKNFCSQRCIPAYRLPARGSSHNQSPAFELVFHIRDVVVRPRCRCSVVFTAAPSAGRPNASQPIGCRSFCPACAGNGRSRHRWCSYVVAHV